MARWVGINKKIIGATPSRDNTSALDRTVSNLSGVIGNFAKPAIQGHSMAAGFRSENNTGYTDNNVAFVKGLCHIFETCYVPELWKEWGKINNVVTGRNILMKRMSMFSRRTDVEIGPSIYIENKLMEELMNAKFSAGNLVPIFKDLERGNSILICATN